MCRREIEQRRRDTKGLPLPYGEREKRDGGIQRCYGGQETNKEEEMEDLRGRTEAGRETGRVGAQLGLDIHHDTGLDCDSDPLFPLSLSRYAPGLC